MAVLDLIYAVIGNDDAYVSSSSVRLAGDRQRALLDADYCVAGLSLCECVGACQRYEHGGGWVMAELNVAPDAVLIDEEVEIRVVGLEPGASVTVIATFEDDGCWRGEATFTASTDGVVDLSGDAPENGDYSGIRPMGLIQFARQVESAPLAKPTDDAGHWLLVRARRDGDVIGEQTVRRRYQRPGVEQVRIDDEHETLIGDLFLPAESPPHPGVIRLGGSEGGRPPTTHPKLLASRGFAVCSLAYFQPSAVRGQSDTTAAGAMERLPDQLAEVPMEYFETAVSWFRACEAVRSDAVGVFGTSRGSEPAVHMAARQPAISAVGLVAPLAYRFSSFSPFGEPAWHADGDPLAYLTNEFSLRDLVRFGWHRLTDRVISLAPSFEMAVQQADDATQTAAAVPIQDITSPLLVVAGEADDLQPSAWFAEQLASWHEAGTDTADCTKLSLSEAGHAIAVPYTPTRGRATSETPVLFGLYLDLGGTPAGYAAADHKSWHALREFFNAHLRATPDESAVSGDACLD